MNASLKTKCRTVLALALPAMIESLLQTVVGFVDTLFVARLGLAEVTAVGVANTLLAVYIAVSWRSVSVLHR
ncbi:multi antimicrobial extrusion protein (Na(+)/drug antiporter), MATE family of MDR efflux pumps [Sporolactobacillus inulinus]|uniref:Multi antimicrobial extrusion protein (Na(+)/drug antiporter), MATE family of MDR efflux pumps n=1 Tax=Sporolactobacillus inulinus TaxID=2078 RepID=A0A4Y1ZAD0_9BACL|nr:multi antimicrobial extrusion protein (Na(+)/drug antiporter), MATE family of MDR efflux pumps [Sporolactobacillus inulinus]